MDREGHTAEDHVVTAHLARVFFVVTASCEPPFARDQRILFRLVYGEQLAIKVGAKLPTP